jgi:hypothetical protein
MFEGLFGKRELVREANPMATEITPAVKKIREDRNIKIAEYLVELKVSAEKAAIHLAKYNAKTIEDLSDGDAEVIESKLEMKVLLQREISRKEEASKYLF